MIKETACLYQGGRYRVFSKSGNIWKAQIILLFLSNSYSRVSLLSFNRDTFDVKI